MGTMKSIAVALLFAIAFTGCDASTSATGLPATKTAESSDALIGTWEYDISSLCQTLTLDGSNVTLTFSGTDVSGPYPLGMPQPVCNPHASTTIRSTYSATATSFTFPDSPWTITRNYSISGDTMTLTDPSGQSGLYAVGPFVRR